MKAASPRDRSRGVAYLLRHLNDAAALSQSPLVLEFWADLSAEGLNLGDIVERVRRAALSAIAELEAKPSSTAARLVAIIRRCEIKGEPHEKLMRDLAISRAEFYRELAAGRRYVLDEIDWHLYHRDFTIDIATGPLELRLHGAATLALGGRIDEAVRHLAPLLDHLHGSERVHVACVLAELRIQANLLLEARVYVQCARETADALDGELRTLALARIAFVESLVALNGDAAAADDSDTLDLHIDRLQKSVSGKSSSAADVLGALITMRAARSAYRGRLAEAFALLQTSPVGDPRARVSLRTRAEHLALLVTVGMLPLRPLEEAASDCTRLYRFANSHGLPHLAAIALADRAYLGTVRGDVQTASMHVREALALADECMLPWDRAGIYSVASFVALHAGHAPRALGLARGAKRLAPVNTYPSLAAMLREIEALYANGRLREALRASKRLERAPRQREYPHVLAQALRVDAEVYRQLGDDRRAQTMVVQSVELLRETECYASLAQSLALAEEMLPNTFAKESKELTALLAIKS